MKKIRTDSEQREERVRPSSFAYFLLPQKLDVRKNQENKSQNGWKRDEVKWLFYVSPRGEKTLSDSEDRQIDLASGMRYDEPGT